MYQPLSLTHRRSITSLPDVRPRSAPALELQSRAESSVGVCTTSSGPNTVSNPEEGRVLKKEKKASAVGCWSINAQV